MPQAEQSRVSQDSTFIELLNRNPDGMTCERHNLLK